MLKVFYSDDVNPLMHSSYAHFLPFEIDKNFISTTSMDDADIIPMLCRNLDDSERDCESILSYLESNNYNGQMIVMLSLFHIDDYLDTDSYHNHVKKYWSSKGLNVISVHTNYNAKENIVYDMLWNRQKAYFTEYDKFNLKNRVWTWEATKRMYELNTIQKNNPVHFLSPNRVYKEHAEHIRMERRLDLQKILLSHHSKGFISNPSEGIILEAEEDTEYTNSFLSEGRGGFWWPVANRYYEQSVTSIYIETLTRSNKCKSITEKTWDPLIKGHFILPYGYNGLVEDIKSYGFMMPDWLDYSYDKIVDDDKRFEAYLESVNAYLNMSIDDVQELCASNIGMLQYNKNIFWERPYDSLHDKLLPYI